MYRYDEEFYRYINAGALRSAEIMIPLVQASIPLTIGSILDVGCGAGAWLSVWKKQACVVLGLDGSYLNNAKLLIEQGEFLPRDLRQQFSLRRQFNLVQCLEVAEHLPPGRSHSLVEDLCKHGDLVFFSASPPGQGGENHINEQPYAYWRDLFAEQHYTMYDPWRRQLMHNNSVMPWYRYNSFLFVNANKHPQCHAALDASRIDEGSDPEDISPPGYQLRKRLIRLLPIKVATGLAITRKTVFRWANRI
ncbi:MAG: methyltransferase domain-containing protein [Gammaproteobacteria bacterium]|nr:methyltransferase domain-containing protein [Gammaproteobacteria bacterium]